MSRIEEIMPSAAGLTRRRLATILLALAAAVAISGVTGTFIWKFLSVRSDIDPMPELSAERAAGVSRRVGVAFDDAELSWAHWFRSRGLSVPPPAELVLFTNALPSPCAGSAPATGPFYCPIDDTAAFDLVFLNALEKRMDRDSGLGTALVVARVMAEHIQAALGVPDAAIGREDPEFTRGLALQADCLAGVWAGMAANRLGTVPPGFYARLMQRAQYLSEQKSGHGQADQPALDIFLFSDDQARETAFRSGLSSRDPRSCPGPR